MPKKRTSLIVLILVLITALLFSSCQTGQIEAPTEAVATQAAELGSAAPAAVGGAAETETAVSPEPEPTSGSVLPQDDYYTYINAEWLEQAEPNEATSRVMRMTQTARDIDERFQRDFEAIVQDGVDEGTEYLSKAADFYRLYTNVEKRNDDGAKPLLPYLEAVDAVRDTDDLNELYDEIIYTGAQIPFSLAVTPDTVDPSKNTLQADTPDYYYLPDVSYYAEGNRQGETQLKERGDAIKRLALAIGSTEDEAGEMASDAIAFDRLIAEYMVTQAELIQETYNDENYMAFDAFCALSENIDFEALISRLTGGAPQEVFVFNAEYFRNIDAIVTETNIPMIKNWIKAGYLYDYADFLSEELYYAKYDDGEDSGEDEGELDFAEHVNDIAFTSVKSNFASELSRYYSDNYLTPEKKADITEMFDGMVDEYKERLAANDWLGDETRAKAIEKLDGIGLIVGHHGMENPATANAVIKAAEQGGTLLECIFSLVENTYKGSFESLPTENTGLGRMGHGIFTVKSYEINAFYVPKINSVIVNAAILNEPYYSNAYSDSRNYGAIGAVIGHEISHAFDTTGSRYDAGGDMVNWWTETDREEFSRRTQKIIGLFDGLPYMGDEVDGVLTAAENTADAGGLSVALEVLEESPDMQADYDEYFRAWAEIWADKATEDTVLLLLRTDTHSPGMYRVNRQMMLIEQFYETYDVREGDGMYLPPEQRFYIW